MIRLNDTIIIPMEIPRARNLFLLYNIASGSIFSIDKVTIIPATNIKNILII